MDGEKAGRLPSVRSGQFPPPHLRAGDAPTSPSLAAGLVRRAEHSFRALLFNAALRQSQNPRGFHRPNVVRHGDGLAGADDHGTIRLPDRHRRNEKRRQVKGGCALSLAGIPRL